MGPLWNSTWAFIPSLTGGPTGPPIGALPQYDFRGGGSVCYGNCLPLALLVFASKLPPPLRPHYQTAPPFLPAPTLLPALTLLPAPPILPTLLPEPPLLTAP